MVNYHCVGTCNLNSLGITALSCNKQVRLKCNCLECLFVLVVQVWPCGTSNTLPRQPEPVVEDKESVQSQISVSLSSSSSSVAPTGTSTSVVVSTNSNSIDGQDLLKSTLHKVGFVLLSVSRSA